MCVPLGDLIHEILMCAPVWGLIKYVITIIDVRTFGGPHLGIMMCAPVGGLIKKKYEIVCLIDVCTCVGPHQKYKYNLCLIKFVPNVLLNDVCTCVGPHQISVIYKSL